MVKVAHMNGREPRQIPCEGGNTLGCVTGPDRTGPDRTAARVGASASRVFEQRT